MVVGRGMGNAEAAKENSTSFLAIDILKALKAADNEEKFSEKDSRISTAPTLAMPITSSSPIPSSDKSWKQIEEDSENRHLITERRLRYRNSCLDSLCRWFFADTRNRPNRDYLEKPGCLASLKKALTPMIDQAQHKLAIYG